MALTVFQEVGRRKQGRLGSKAQACLPRGSQVQAPVLGLVRAHQVRVAAGRAASSLFAVG